MLRNIGLKRSQKKATLDHQTSHSSLEITTSVCQHAENVVNRRTSRWQLSFCLDEILKRKTIWRTYWLSWASGIKKLFAVKTTRNFSSSFQRQTVQSSWIACHTSKSTSWRHKTEAEKGMWKALSRFHSTYKKSQQELQKSTSKNPSLESVTRIMIWEKSKSKKKNLFSSSFRSQRPDELWLLGLSHLESTASQCCVCCLWAKYRKKQ